MSPDIYCLNCGVFMKKITTGHVVANKPEHQPTMHRRGDRFKCPGCGFEVLGDFGAWY